MSKQKINVWCMFCRTQLVHQVDGDYHNNCSCERCDAFYKVDVEGNRIRQEVLLYPIKDLIA